MNSKLSGNKSITAITLNVLLCLSYLLDWKKNPKTECIKTTTMLFSLSLGVNGAQLG